jgi:hypothetical protein
MAKKPKLELVGASTGNATASPVTLGKDGAALWRAIMSEYEIADAGGLEMLGQACGAADWVAEFAAAIDRDGPVVRTKQGPKEHPLLKHELAARSFVVRTLARLGLEPVKMLAGPTRRTDWETS